MFENFISLKKRVGQNGSVIRFKDFVLVSVFKTGPRGEWFEAEAWSPIETEDEADVDFFHLRLENVTEWYGERFNTEGEALFAAMQAVEAF